MIFTVPDIIERMFASIFKWSLARVRPNAVLPLAIAVLVSSATLVVPRACAQLPFFSGAEGFGSTFTGSQPPGGWFSNATVYHVTNLNDSGAGSLRAAFVENSSNKIIVFDVAGTIQLTSGTLRIKNLSNYYIAGQTAPGPVTVYGATTKISASPDKTNNNIILRYLSLRGSDPGDDTLSFKDGNASNPSNHMIADHVSASWSQDEVLSVANENTNITIQYSIIADALTSDHAYGSLIRPTINSSVSYQHNLYANNASRQPRPGSYNGTTLTFDFRNNVVYNWRDRAGYSGGSSEAEQEFVNMNYVGNYMVAGPGTNANVNGTFFIDKNVDMAAYNRGNFVDSDKGVNGNGVPNGIERGSNMIQLNSPTDQSLVQVASPFTANPVTTQSAPNAFNQVLNYVGNFWWSRGPIDTRIINKQYRAAKRNCRERPRADGIGRSA
jgi:hypothetical protein